MVKQSVPTKSKIQQHRDFFGEFQRNLHRQHPTNMGTWCIDTVILYTGSLKSLTIIINQQNMGLWCNDALFSREFQMTEHIHQYKHLKSTCILSIGWMQIRI